MNKNVLFGYHSVGFLFEKDQRHSHSFNILNMDKDNESNDDIVIVVVVISSPHQSPRCGV